MQLVKPSNDRCLNEGCRSDGSRELLKLCVDLPLGTVIHGDLMGAKGRDLKEEALKNWDLLKTGGMNAA